MPLLTLFVVLGIVTAFLAINLGLLDRRPSVRPGPATDELFDEPPAIVALLTNGFRPSPAAAAATLADLATRGVLRVDGTAWWIGSADTETRAYERLVLDLIPASGEAVTWGELRVAFTETEFTQAFQTAVVSEAASRGLVRPTLRRTSSGRAEVVLLRVQRPTPAGKEAASRWLGVRLAMAAEPVWRSRDISGAGEHGRRLAYAIALGLTPTTDARDRAPAHAAPANGAGSAQTEGSRQPTGPDDIPVLAPRGGSTTTPRDVVLRYLLIALAGCLFGIGFVTAGLLGWVGPAVAGLVALIALAGAGRGLADIRAPRTIEGTIIRKVLLHYDPYAPPELGRARGGGPVEISPVAWVAIDDGHSRPVRGVRLHPDIADHLRVGDVVRARIAPRVCWIYSIAVVGHDPHDRTSSA